MQSPLHAASVGARMSIDDLNSDVSNAVDPNSEGFSTTRCVCDPHETLYSSLYWSVWESAASLDSRNECDDSPYRGLRLC